MKLKVIEIECERTIGRAAHDLADLLDHRRLSVASKAHHFVLVLIHLEAEVRREGRIQHSQGMRKSDFSQASDCRGAVFEPLASLVKIAARRVGAVRKEAAAWDS